MHALRDKYKADVAVLFVHDPMGCGLATRVAAEADEAFAVVHHECATSMYSLAHEIGHIIGARHDYALDSTAAPFPFGHGYVYGAQWRTIMSYKDTCNDCPRLPVWSSPSVKVKGVARGLGPARQRQGDCGAGRTRRGVPMKPLVHYFIAVLFAASAGGDAASAAETRAQQFRLENGLEVIVIPDHRAPIVTHVIAYRVGSADDPPGSSGIAHFLEHLMYKSTARAAAGGFARAVSRLGGRENATTTHDTTIYHQRVPKQSLAKVMALEADRMSGLRFDPDEVRLERNVIIEERRQRIELSPINLLNEQMAAALHLNHPYRAPVLGWAHEMSRLTREDAMAFYARYYAPNNALLVVQGDVEVGDVLRLAREAYGPIPPGQIVDPKARPRDPEPRAARRVELVDGRVTNASLFRSYFVAIDAGDDPAGEREALEILVRVLAQGDTSRLHKRLVERDRSAILTEGGTSTTRDGTRIALYAVAAIDEKLEPIEQAIEDEIRDVAEPGHRRRRVVAGAGGDRSGRRVRRRQSADARAALRGGDRQRPLDRGYRVEKRASGSGNERERPLGGSQASVARAIGHRSAAAAASGDRIATIRIGSSAMRRTPSAMGPSPSLSASLAVVLLTLAAASWCRPALASGIQRVTSTGGITAWLAEDHASPLLSLRFAFIGGSAAEPLRQGGVSRVLARLLLEGSDEPDFKMRVQRAGLRIGFQSGRDALFGSAD